MDVELQILKHLKRDAQPTVAIIDQYCVAMDVDNIVKPIQDAIIGLVYVDDNQITDVLVRKRDLFVRRRRGE